MGVEPTSARVSSNRPFQRPVRVAKMAQSGRASQRWRLEHLPRGPEHLSVPVDLATETPGLTSKPYAAAIFLIGAPE
jgi:hypothetical protein